MDEDGHRSRPPPLHPQGEDDGEVPGRGGGQAQRHAHDRTGTEELEIKKVSVLALQTKLTKTYFSDLLFNLCLFPVCDEISIELG